jgi:hypothetical protein
MEAFRERGNENSGSIKPGNFFRNYKHYEFPKKVLKNSFGVPISTTFYGTRSFFAVFTRASPPLVPILGQMNPIHILGARIFKIFPFTSTPPKWSRHFRFSH